METEAYTLYSGSSGNSVYIRAGEDAILIDGGKSSACLVRGVASVGGDMSAVRAIFVTHEHRDHVSALDVTSRKYRIPVHITEDSLTSLGSELCGCAVPHTPMYSVNVGPFTVKSFPTHHDSACSVGYTVDIDGAGVRIGVLTDTGFVSGDMAEALFGCTHAVIEANHDVDMLMRGPYPPYLKSRILSNTGHLSNDAAAILARELLRRGTGSFLLAHISRENNTPALAMSTVGAALEGEGRPFSLNFAPHDAPARLI